MQYQKMLYTISGNAVPDNWGANYKIPSSFFKRFVTQQNQYLLGNGVSWGNPETGEKLGKMFDTSLQQIGKKALIGGVAFGFWNLDHVEVFSVLEFAPLYDEENGALSSGVRYWQIDPSKPLRATLYEMDGYTEYIWRDGIGSILRPKRSYKVNFKYTDADGEMIFDGENYPAFPIVPLYANDDHQSEIVGIREGIDCYDFVKSGYADDLHDISQIFWTIHNAGGMDDIDLAGFVQRLKTVHAAAVQDGQTVEAHTQEVPYSARQTMLEIISKDLYRDFMALDTENIAAGAITATQIKAAYTPPDNKVDEYEYQVGEFIQGILNVAGIDDTWSFTRSKIVNTTETITNLVQAAEYLAPDYITRKILEELGDGDKADEMLAQMAADEIDRFNAESDEEEQNTNAPAEEGGGEA